MQSITDVYILTGKIASGKTTGLLAWLGDRDPGGFATPVVNGKRMLYLLKKKKYLPFECVDTEAQDVEIIGRYRFYKEAFVAMDEMLQQAILQNTPWLIVDEVGPLELKGGGLHDALINLLHQRKQPVLLVVREGLVEEVCNKFSIIPKAVLGIEDLKKLSDKGE